MSTIVIRKEIKWAPARYEELASHKNKVKKANSILVTIKVFLVKTPKTKNNPIKNSSKGTNGARASIKPILNTVTLPK